MPCPPHKPLSARILVAGYWMFIILMLATFTANLAAFLTIERMQSTVQVSVLVISLIHSSVFKLS